MIIDPSDESAKFRADVPIGDRVGMAVGTAWARGLGKWLSQREATVGPGPWIIHPDGRVADLGDHECRWRDDSVRLNTVLYAAAVLLGDVEFGASWEGEPDELVARLLDRLAGDR